jgi:hypothetical protein
MARKRPTAVLVLAILNIVFGSLWTLMGLCGGVAFAFVMNTMPKIMAQATAKTGQPPMPDMFTYLQERAPGFMGFIYASIAMMALLGLLLLCSGLGLLKMRTWAWWGSIIFAVVTILQQLLGVYTNVKYTNPVMADYYRDLDKWQRQVTPAQQPIPNPALAIWDNPTLTVVMSLAGVAFNCAYPVVLLLVLLRPSIRAAFTDRPPPDETEEVLNVLPAGDRPPPSPLPKGVT